MNIMNQRFDASILNNHTRTVEKNLLKEQRDNLVQLVNLGLISNDLASEHGIWQGYRGIIDNTSANSLTKKELPSECLPSVEDAIKAYKSSVDDAINHGLIKDPFEEALEAIYKKSL